MALRMVYKYMADLDFIEKIRTYNYGCVGIDSEGLLRLT